jgi:hypothetical protein
VNFWFALGRPEGAGAARRGAARRGAARAVEEGRSGSESRRSLPCLQCLRRQCRQSPTFFSAGCQGRQSGAILQLEVQEEAVMEESPARGPDMAWRPSWTARAVEAGRGEPRRCAAAQRPGSKPPLVFTVEPRIRRVEAAGLCGELTRRRRLYVTRLKKNLVVEALPRLACFSTIPPLARQTAESKLRQLAVEGMVQARASSSPRIPPRSGYSL